MQIRFARSIIRVLVVALLMFLCLEYLAAQTALQTYLSLAGQTSDPDTSADGKDLAFVWWPPDHDKSGIYISPTGGGGPAPFAFRDSHGDALSPRWSPDGKWIAFLRSGSAKGASLFVKSRVSGEERFLGIVCNGPEAWSADSGSVIAASPDAAALGGPCDIQSYPIQAGLRLHQRLGITGTFPVVSRDGKMLAFIHDRQVQMLAVSPDGQPVGAALTVTSEPLGVSILAWTLDGKEIIYVASDDHSLIRRVAARPGALSRDVGRVNGELDSLDVTPGGELLGGAEIRDASYLSVSLGDSTSQPVAVRSLPWNVGPARISPDGRTLLYSISVGSRSEVFVSNLAGGGLRRVLQVGCRVEELDWSPDGRQFAMIGPSGTEQSDPSRLFVASVEQGSVRPLLTQFDGVYGAAWSPEGSALFVSAESAGRNSTWKLTLGDGLLTEVSDATASELAASADNKFLYLRRLPFNLVRMPIGGGALERVADGVMRFVVGKDKAYVERQDSTPPDAAGLNLYRVDSPGQAPQFVAHIGFVPATMQLSLDGKIMYLERVDPPQARVVAVQGWR